MGSEGQLDKELYCMVFAFVLVIYLTLICFISKYISRRLGLNFMLVIAVAIVFPPAWILCMVASLFINKQGCSATKGIVVKYARDPPMTTQSPIIECG